MNPATQPLRGLYVITDPRWTPASSLLSQVESALRGGARIVQYRDKLSDDGTRRATASRLLSLCKAYQRQLIINDDVTLCAELGAHGVHLGRSDSSIALARQQLGPDAIIGATCHNSLDAARQAKRDGASYAAFGRFFPSQTKPEAPPARLEDLLPELRGLAMPTVAIGGITLATAPPLIDAGFSMLAVIHDVFSHPDIESQCARYCALFP